MLFLKYEERVTSKQHLTIIMYFTNPFLYHNLTDFKSIVISIDKNKILR